MMNRLSQFFYRLLTEGVYLKPFLIATVIMFLQQFCGVNVVIFYAETIFIKAGSTIDPGMTLYFSSLNTYDQHVIIDLTKRYEFCPLLFYS